MTTWLTGDDTIRLFRKMAAETGLKLSPKTSGVRDSLARNGLLRDGGSNAANGDSAGGVVGAFAASPDDVDGGEVASGRAVSSVIAGGAGATVDGAGFDGGRFGDR